ncbi:MAG: hypothetical protein M3198_03855 [Actinomycetota bacterium]|nr:hypothetical protein [Actinomycetota bacterium]
MHPDIEWITDVLWPGAEIRLERGSPSTSGGDRYTVVGWGGRPRFLVPEASRRASSASLFAYNKLRSLGTRAARTTMGMAVQLPPGLLRLPTLTADVSGDRSLGARLSDIFGREDLAAAVGIPPVGPNRKPVLQVFTLGGRPVGYVKVGWNEATRRRVRHEARALEHWRGATGRRTRLPHLVSAGRWGEHEISVTAPLPTDVTHYPSSLGPPMLTFRDVCDLDGGLSTTTLAEIAGVTDLDSRLEVAATIDPERAHAATRLTEAVRERFGGLQTLSSIAHGDCVPWNLARHRDALYLFDWEHWSGSMPVGFDLLYWHFQVAFVVERNPLADALDRATALTRNRMTAVGARDEIVPALACLLLVELYLRAAEGVAAGAPENARFHPHIKEALSVARQTLAG